jgi:hypothetical protein
MGSGRRTPYRAVPDKKRLWGAWLGTSFCPARLFPLGDGLGMRLEMLLVCFAFAKRFFILCELAKLE